MTKTCLTGELWGMANLFKNSLDILETHQVIGDTRAAEELRIETANFSGLARAPPSSLHWVITSSEDASEIYFAGHCCASGCFALARCTAHKWRGC